MAKSSISIEKLTRDESGDPRRKEIMRGAEEPKAQRKVVFLVYCSRRSSTKTVTGPKAKHGYKGYQFEKFGQGMQRSFPDEKKQAHGSSQVPKQETKGR